MHFQILGPLRVTAGDEREIALGGAKPAAVLAMLLLRPNEVVAADRLIEDLWDGTPPPTAAKTLQVHMSRLRRALGEVTNGGPSGSIDTSAGGYVLRVADDQIDARRFEAAVAEGSAALADREYARASARLREALGLWRGEALADFAYASFAQDEIARLDGLRTVALESAIEAELSLGRHAGLIPELKFLVKRFPLSEHLRAQLMLALYRAGRQAEALGVYRVGRRILVDQLGIEPSEELRELERAILAQDAALALPEPEAPRKSATPRPRGTLVGYESELSAIEELLERALAGDGGVVLVAGEPGVGKTRLADELGAVARTRGARVAWGRCWTGAGAPAYWAWTQVLREVSGDREPPTSAANGADQGDDARFRLFESVASALTRAAAAAPLVIVLDDLHAADQATLSLLEFVAASTLDAPILLIATYRDSAQALDRPLVETLATVARVSDCLQLVLTGLSVEDTAHFVEISAGVAPMPHLAQAIHDASSGNPLFVTELVRLLQAEDRLQELDDERKLVVPKGIEQVIERRLERLPEDARGSLRAAAVIGREFDLDLLGRVTGTAPAALLEQLDGVIASGIVEVDAEHGASLRFAHELIRHALYASLPVLERRRLHAGVAAALEELLGARAESSAAVLAHHLTEAAPLGDLDKTVHYLDLAADAAAEVSAAHEAAALYGEAAEIGRANKLDHQRLRELYVKQAEQLVLAPNLDETRAALAEANALAAQAPDRLLDKRVALVDANVHLHATCTQADLAKVEQLVEFFDEIGDVKGAARALWVCATFYCGMSQRAKEAEMSRRMLEYARRSGSRALVNRGLRVTASSLAFGPTPATEALERVIELEAEIDDDATRARVQMARATLEATCGHFDAARQLIDEAILMAPLSERAGARDLALAYGGRIEWMARNFRRTEEIGRDLASSYQAQGLEGFLASELMNLVDALSHQGKLAEAERYLAVAAACLQPEDVDAQFRQARSSARIEFGRGNLEAAEAAARAALRWLAAAEVPDEQAETLLVLADVLRASEREEEALAAADEALRLAVAREHVPLEQQAREFADERVPLRA